MPKNLVFLSIFEDCSYERPLRARQGRSVGGRETDPPDGGAEHHRLLQLDQGEVVGPGVAINHWHI